MATDQRNRSQSAMQCGGGGGRVAFQTNDWAPPDRMTGQWEVEARKDDRGGEKQKEKFLRKIRFAYLQLPEALKKQLGVDFKPPISTELPRGIADGLVVLVPRKPRGVMRLGTWGLGSIP
ncbi:Lysine--tRNA ligase, partial [Frankliniella fusca]